MRISSKKYDECQFITNLNNVIIDIKPITKNLVRICKVFEENGLICGNIKPSNLILKDNGDLLLLDHSQYLLNNTSSYYTYYFSPEQLFNKEVDYNTDIYLCGLVYYYLVRKEDYFTSNMRKNIQLMKETDERIDKLKTSNMKKIEMKPMLKYNKKERNLDLFHLERIYENTSILYYLLYFIISLFLNR